MHSSLVQGRRYDTGEQVEIAVADGRIAHIRSRPSTLNSQLPCLAPAWLDIQVNGHGGIWYSQPGITAEQVLATLEAQPAFGTARLCPTLVTQSPEVLLEAARAIRAACEAHPWADHMVAGIHLEGPYISAEEGPRGAHPAEHVRPPDWDEFEELQHASGGRIRLVTLAPETPGAIEFIRRLAATGVVPAIGHTAAEPQTIAEAVDAGARLSTHLGNGAHPLMPRHPNYIWEQLADDRLWASIICDGHHLPASVVKTILRTKPPGKVVLISDASGLAGLPPGRYDTPSGAVEILADGAIVIAGPRPVSLPPGGAARPVSLPPRGGARPVSLPPRGGARPVSLPPRGGGSGWGGGLAGALPPRGGMRGPLQLLAGSAVGMDACIAGAMRFGVTLREAVEMATARPARLLGLEEPRLAPGAPADLVLFDADEQTGQVRVTETWLQGRRA